MKKIYFLAIALLTFSATAMAQSSKGAYSEGDGLLNVGIGIGSPFFGSGYSSSLPVNPSISYEKGITDVISVGGQLSYASSKLTFLGSSIKYSATYVGARGSYHLNEALDVSDKFDIYGGASLGYVIVSVSDGEGGSGSAASAIGFGAFAGGKYYFKERTAIYAELGYQSLSFLNVGIAFKF